MKKKRFTAIAIIFGIISLVLAFGAAAMLVPPLRDRFGIERYVEQLFGKGSFYIAAGAVCVLLALSLSVMAGSVIAAVHSRKKDSEGRDTGAVGPDPYRTNALEELRKAENIMAEIDAISKGCQGKNIPDDEN